MASIKCIPLTEGQKNRMNALNQAAADFGKDKSIQQFGEYGVDIWKNIKRKVIGENMPSDNIPSVEQIALIKRVANTELKNIAKDRSGIAEWAYLPMEIYKDVPFVKNWFRDVQQSNAVFKGNNAQSKILMQNIYDLLKAASLQDGFARRYAKEGSTPQMDKPGSVKSFFKDTVHSEISKRYEKYRALLREGSKSKAYEYYKAEIETYLADGEGQVLKDFHQLVTMETSLYDKMKSNSKYKYVHKAAAEWKKLDKFAMNLNLEGLKNYKKALENNSHILKEYEGYKETVANVGKVYERLLKHSKNRDAYFPVLTFDILPTLGEVSGKLFNGNAKQFKEGADVVAKLEGILDNNIYVNRTMNKGGERGKEIEYNVIPIMDSYVKTAARFNFVSYNNGKYIGAMKNLWKSYSSSKDTAPTELDRKIEFYESYMSDTHSLVTGEKYRGSEMQNNFARALTSYQFASKLGLNIRSAARNSTQSLLNYVHFGGKSLYDFKQWKGNPENVSRVQQGLANNGTLFGEIREVYMDNLTTNVKNKDGTYSPKFDLSVGDKIAQGLNVVAEKSGVLMQAVENNLNRRWTFELGYSEKWKADDLIEPTLKVRYENKLKRQLKEEGKGRTVEALKQETATIFNKNDSNAFEVGFENYRRDRAERMGEKAVNLLHFDYSAIAKPKFLTTPVGSVVGQFQFYGLSFFNLQRNIASKGGNAILAGQWNHPSAYRMYRLGLLYTAVSGLIAPFLNMDLGNLVQNDTYERIKQVVDYLGDDKEASEAAYFGKGIFVGQLGPTVADFVNLGNLSTLYKLDPDGWAALLTGYEDLSDLSGDEKIEKAVRSGNTQVGRGIYDSIPKLRKGVNPFVVFQGELSLYSNKKIKERRLWLGKNVPVFGKYFLDEQIMKKNLNPEPRKLNRTELTNQRLDNMRIAMGMKSESQRAPVKDPYGRDKSVLEALEKLSLNSNN